MSREGVIPGERYQEKMCVIISNENDHDALIGEKKLVYRILSRIFHSLRDDNHTERGTNCHISDGCQQLSTFIVVGRNIKTR